MWSSCSTLYRKLSSTVDSCVTFGKHFSNVICLWGRETKWNGRLWSHEERFWMNCDIDNADICVVSAKIVLSIQCRRSLSYDVTIGRDVTTHPASTTRLAPSFKGSIMSLKPENTGTTVGDSFWSQHSFKIASLMPSGRTLFMSRDNYDGRRLPFGKMIARKRVAYRIM